MDVENCNVTECFVPAAMAETRLEASRHAQLTLDSIGDAVVCSDLTGCITYMNAAAEKLTGWSNEQAIGCQFSNVLHIVDATTREIAFNPTLIAIRDDKMARLASNCVLIGRNGVEVGIEDSVAPIHAHDGKIRGAVMVFRDVSNARALSARVSHQARHDSLTDLPNRVVFSDRLAQAIVLAQRHQQRLAVLFLDMDRFKHINDSFGHAIGDRLLQVVAQRLLTCVRSSDTVSRQGGDEFVILLSEITHALSAAITAEKIIAILRLPYRIDGHDLHLSASIGIANYPEDGIEAETLMKHADLSMYHAKENGRNNYQFFKADLNVHAMERRALENDLHQALRHNELTLRYQPQVNIQTGAIVGVEVLMRWQHPQRGLISPSQFIPIAKECGSIISIGRWALRQACSQAYRWQCAGLPSLRIAINISAVELRSKGFVADVRDILIETGLNPRYLELELTETFLTQHLKAVTEVLNGLKELGVQLALDDFGTGHSSLSYLKDIPIDTLKIDQSFVRDLIAGTDSSGIVSAVICTGKSLRVRVVAKGVESQAQLDFLKKHDCAEGQGFYFGQPVCADEFTQLLRSSISAAARRSRISHSRADVGTDMFLPSAELNVGGSTL